MIESQGDARRRREKRDGRSAGWARKGIVALTASATVGAALIAGGAPAYADDNPLGALGGLGLGDITSLLDNPLLLEYVEMCDNPDGSTPTPQDGDEFYAVADCSKSTGTGIAVVLPGSIEVGAAAEGMDINLPVYGDKNLIQIVSMLALNDYLGLQKSYKTYEQVQHDANLPRDIATADTCVKSNGDRYKVPFYGCLLDAKIKKGADLNEPVRKNALKIAEYLTGDRYNYGEPTVLPGKPAPVGSATVAGPGIQLALAMTGGTALAETGHKLGLATAGAGEGRTSSAYSYLGMANALNLDTDQITMTWFGKELDFDRLRGNVIVDLIGGDNLDMLDDIEGLQIPALKEVSCFGVFATAFAEDLGSCTNVLGTFDMYQDERAPKAGESRQTQYGLTDVTSLVLGNNALLKQLNGTSESTPFMDSLMDNLTSEEGRLKFAKDFVRFTQDVKTETVLEPKLDEDGNKVLDDDGNPVLVPALDEDGNEITTTTTAAYLTSDYGFVNPITIEWMGHRVVLFPAVTVNGEERPNYLSLPQIEKIVADADTGEMPKISVVPKVSLVQWANPFGLGTLTLDKPLNPVHTLRNFFETVTIVDDLKGVGELVGGSTGSGSTGTGPTGSGSTGDAEAEQPGDNTDDATDTKTDAVSVKDSTGKPQDDAAKSPANTTQPDASTTTPAPTTPATTPPVTTPPATSTPSTPDASGTSGAQSDDEDEQDDSADAA